MPPKAKLSDLAMALESDNMADEHISRFDRGAGEVVYVEAEVLRSGDFVKRSSNTGSFHLQAMRALLPRPQCVCHVRVGGGCGALDA